MEELLTELNSRLNGLACLPLPTVQRIRAWAATAEPAWLRGYLDHILSFVEAIHAQGAPAFHWVCDELREQDDEQALLARFGGGGEYNQDTWLQLEPSQPSVAEREYCTANKYALTAIASTEQLAELESQADLLALSVRHERDGPESAIRWAEERLGLNRDSYHSTAELARIIRPRLSDEPLSALNGLRFITLFADALHTVGRGDDAVRVFLAVLDDGGGPPSVTGVAAAVTGFFDRLNRLVPEDLLSQYPELQKQWSSDLSLSTAVFVSVWAEIDLELRNADRALSVVATMLGVWPVDAAGLDRLEVLRQCLQVAVFHRLVHLWARAAVGANRRGEALHFVLALAHASGTAGSVADPFPACWATTRATAIALTRNHYLAWLGALWASYTELH